MIMSKIVRFSAFGGPEVLRLEEMDVREPDDDEVRIRVAAMGLNRVETDYRRGGFGPVRFPARIGYEAAGVIESTGAGVNDFAPGDHVAILPGLSMEQYGTNGETILYPANMLVKIPQEQAFEQAAAAWMQYLTAYALVAVAGIRAGEHVVITAASSSVGLAALQIANASGAIPIAVTRCSGKADALKVHGAAHVVASEEQDCTAAILDITGGRGARIVFDAVAGPQLAALAAATAPGGIIVVYGTLAGGDIHLPAYLLMMPNITLRGFSANSLLAEPKQRAEVITYINQGLASGTLRPVIDRCFDLSEIAEAHRYLEANTHIGKIVVTTRGYSR
jgi:NADPH:quinone reductase